MVEDVVLSQSFPVVGGDDHERPIELTAPLQFVEQLAEPLVEIGEAVVVRIASQGPEVLR